MMKKMGSLAIVVLFLLTMMLGVYSETAGSLTIQYTRKDTGQGIGDVELSVFKAADLRDGQYEATAAFDGAEVDFNDLDTADKRYTAAELLYRYALRTGATGEVKRTGPSGIAVFKNLLPGVYLVAQTKEKTGYKTISPYIIFMPEQGISNTLVYDVFSNVKTEREDSGSHGGSTSSVTVTKIWDDSDNADGIRPDSISVTLLRNGAKYKTASLNSANHWKYTFSNVPGNLSGYTVEETPVAGYTASYSGSAAKGFVITNKHDAASPVQPDKLSISVRKQWNDDNNKRGIRPDNAAVQLIKDGVVFRTAQLDHTNDWSYCFEQLPDAEYTVKEVSPDGYSASYNRINGGLYIITNTIGMEPDEPPLPPVKPSVVNISVKKVWNDQNNADGTRPDSMTVDLIKDGEKYTSAQLTEENGWQYTFSDLPQSENYSIYENTDGKYEVSYSGSAALGYVITNTYPTENPVNEQPAPSNPSVTRIPVEKFWNDMENERGLRPQSVKIQLIRSGSVYRELELSESGDWKGVFEDVPVNDSYSIIETEVQDYSATYGWSETNGFTVTNTVTPGTTDAGTPPMSYVPNPGTASGDSGGTAEASAAVIPQTGSLNWPIPLLVVSGIVFLILGIAGISDKRRNME